MKKYKIEYSDVQDTRPTRYTTKPFPAQVAHQVARELETFGCRDFAFIPVKDKS